MDISETLTPRSDQINADDLISGPVTVTIAEVTRGTDEQPVNIVTQEFGPERPYKPSKTMRRIMVVAWGAETAPYVGRRMTLYRDPEITFGRDKVGGIRISHMSDIERRISVALTVTRGKRAQFTVDPLPPVVSNADSAKTFARRISAARSVAELAAVAADLKTHDLGAEREKLLAAWTERRTALEKETASDGR